VNVEGQTVKATLFLFRTADDHRHSAVADPRAVWVVAHIEVLPPSGEGEELVLETVTRVAPKPHSQPACAAINDDMNESVEAVEGHALVP